MKKYVISATIDNAPGILTRVCQLFNKRAYNLESVTAGVTENQQVSRLTLITKVQEENQINQIIKQIRKLENVNSVMLMDNSNCICKEIMFVRVKAEIETRPKIMNVAEIFKAHIANVSPTDLVLQITGDENKLIAFIELLKPFGILELVSSGSIAIQRGRNNEV